MLANANGLRTSAQLREAAEAAQALGKELKPLTVAVEADFASAFASLEQAKGVALVVQTGQIADRPHD